MILGRCLRTDQIALPEYDGWRALRFRAQFRVIPLTSSKADEIPDFAGHRHGRHQIDSAQRHERLDCRAHPPVLEMCAHRLGEQFDPPVSLAHGAAILGKGDVLHGMGEVHHETNGAPEYLVFRKRPTGYRLAA